VAQVLVLDDDPAIARYAAMALTLDGHRVRAELSVPAATAALAISIPEVLVLDVRVGPHDGLEFLASLRRWVPSSMQVILHTSECWDRVGARAMLLGVRDVVAKPSDPDVLARAVERAADRALHLAA
jgi:two-component system response regulator GlrR